MQFFTHTLVAVTKQAQFGDGFHERQIEREISQLVPELSGLSWKRATHASGLSLLYAELSPAQARKLAAQYGKKTPRVGYQIDLIRNDKIILTLLNKANSFELNLHQQATL